MARRIRVALIASIGLASAAASARAAEPNWDRIADVGTIEVVTHDEDGDARETTIWFAVLDGQGFIRTGDSRWGANVRRNPGDVVLRIQDQDYQLRAEFIENDSLRERVVAAFRAKYGWFDGFINFVRGSRPNIMHMISR